MVAPFARLVTAYVPFPVTCAVTSARYAVLEPWLQQFVVAFPSAIGETGPPAKVTPVGA